MIRALVSVWEKEGLVEFLERVKKLENLEIIATTSTAKFLSEKGFGSIPVEDITHFPEILGGRVKTLHPKIFGGILARTTEADKKHMSEFEIPQIDLVIVNLYPFEEKLKLGLTQDEMIEFIDIGGPSLLRAAAKNSKRVAVISSKEQYDLVASSLEKESGKFSNDLRATLARQVFARTAHYDTQIGQYLSQCIESGLAKENGYMPGNSNMPSRGNMPRNVNINLSRYQELRYGENPHQSATWYASEADSADKFESFPPFKQLQGKELSSNNITDTYCLVKILRDIKHPAACIIKHNNPCGVASGATLMEAFDKAFNTDPVSAFGGIYGFTEAVSAPIAQKIVEGFVEIVAAPSFESGAIDVFKAKKNVRLLELKPGLLENSNSSNFHIRDLEDFGWILEKDTVPPVTVAQFEKVSGKVAEGKLLEDAAFAWAVVRHLTSNAIFIAKDGVSLGFGIGQTSRIASVEIALTQAGEKARGAVLASDAFFPAIDNIEAAAKAGISVIVQPGGSIKDKEVITACEGAGITMLFTGQRCFKH